MQQDLRWKGGNPMNSAALALVLLLLVAAWLFLRKKKASSNADSRPAQTSTRTNTAFHAVSIKFSENACTAAKAMAGRRFLATETPSLPLPECNVLECHCCFNHHGDRRITKDRRSPFAQSGATDGTGSFERERRNKKDRRQDDSEF